ncbi:MAG: hypothetical protein EZS28_041212, partial [Streblomastix strix]
LVDLRERLFLVQLMILPVWVTLSVVVGVVKEPEQKEQKLQQYSRLMDQIERFHEIKKQIIEEEKKKLKIIRPECCKKYPKKLSCLLLPAQELSPNTNIQTKIPKSHRKTRELDLRYVCEGTVPYCLRLTDNLEAQANQPSGSYIPGLLNVSDGLIQLIYVNIQKYKSLLGTLISLIIFVTEQNVQSETQSKDQEQFMNEQERIVADGTDDNGDEDQSEHAIEPKHFTNGNNGLRLNDSGTQLQATVNGEANHEINITKISANIPIIKVNGSDRFGGNGCETQFHAKINENGGKNPSGNRLQWQYKQQQANQRKQNRKK